MHDMKLDLKYSSIVQNNLNKFYMEIYSVFITHNINVVKLSNCNMKNYYLVYYYENY